MICIQQVVVMLMAIQYSASFPTTVQQTSVVFEVSTTTGPTTVKPTSAIPDVIATTTGQPTSAISELNTTYGIVIESNTTTTNGSENPVAKDCVQPLCITKRYSVNQQWENGAHLYLAFKTNKKVRKIHSIVIKLKHPLPKSSTLNSGSITTIIKSDDGYFIFFKSIPGAPSGQNNPYKFLFDVSFNHVDFENFTDVIEYAALYNGHKNWCLDNEIDEKEDEIAADDAEVIKIDVDLLKSNIANEIASCKNLPESVKHESHIWGHGESFNFNARISVVESLENWSLKLVFSEPVDHIEMWNAEVVKIEEGLGYLWMVLPKDYNMNTDHLQLFFRVSVTKEEIPNAMLFLCAGDTNRAKKPRRKTTFKAGSKKLAEDEPSEEMKKILTKAETVAENLKKETTKNEVKLSNNNTELLNDFISS